jgi:hypothetical protein
MHKSEHFTRIDWNSRFRNSKERHCRQSSGDGSSIQCRARTCEPRGYHLSCRIPKAVTDSSPPELAPHWSDRTWRPQTCGPRAFKA